MRKKLSRIIAILLACFVLFGFGSCDVDDPEMQPSQGDDALISMYGTKVLYRPDSYDFNHNSGGTTENPNDYYGDYAYSILLDLFYTFAIPEQNQDTINKYFNNGMIDNRPDPVFKKDLKDDEGFNIKNTYFLYDSIRYQINSIGEVFDTITINDNGKSIVWDENTVKNESETIAKIKKLYNFQDDGDDVDASIRQTADQKAKVKFDNLKAEYERYKNSEQGQIVLGADTSQKWKWSFDKNYTNMNVPLIKTDGNSQYTIKDTIENNSILKNNYKSDVAIKNTANNIFTLGLNSFETRYPAISSLYQSLYLGKTSKDDKEHEYSDYVKALEYVIYCYALDLEPQQMRIDTSTTGKPYTIQVGAYTGSNGKSSVDVALEDIKTLFNRMGSMVGLMDRQIDKLKAWIKQNVIGITGSNPSITDDYFYIYNYKKVVEIAGTNTTTYYIPEQINRVDLGRDYDRVVDEILKNVVDKASIGKNPDGSDVTVDDKYLASEIIEYSGDTFMVNDDSFFPKYEPGQNLRCIRPLEYQSAVVMFSKPTAFTDVGVILKYDADLDGTEKGKWDMNKYLDIIVELNYYNHQANKMFTLDSVKTRVYDGPYEWGVTSEDYPEYPDLPADHGLVGLSVNKSDPDLKPFLVDTNDDEDVLLVNSFNTEIGGGILKTDASSMNYCNPLIPISNNPLVIVGSTDVRKYYSIIEPTDDELGTSGQTYLTGRLNPNMFSGNDGCDYLEITYKVLKDNNDTNKNYKFYTSLWTIL